MKLVCKNCGITKKHYAKGLCHRCYLNKWRTKNPQKIKEYEKKQYEKHKEEKREKSKEFYSKHPEYQKKWQRNNIIKRRKSWRDYYYKNQEAICKKNREYFQKNKEKCYQYRKNKYQNDIHFKLRICMSTAISKSIKGKKNGKNWESLVDYKLKDLMKYLENKFSKGMTWENYGKWEIDHIIPMSAFDLKGHNDPDFKRCWALNNLQPLWRKENQRKSGKLLQSLQLTLKNEEGENIAS